MADLPEILWFQTFKCLTLGDFAKLRLVSKKFLALTDHFDEIYETECLRIYTSPLSLFEY